MIYYTRFDSSLTVILSALGLFVDVLEELSAVPLAPPHPAVKNTTSIIDKKD